MPPRLIDLGLPRTGTQSLANGLAMLGYARVYHMREVDNNEGHRAAWIQLMDDKYGPERRPVDLDKLRELLKDYDAGADFPVSMFPLEMVAAFPDAKIIVTVRDQEAWYRSMDSTLVYARDARKGKPAEARHELADKYHKYLWDDDFERNGLKFWREHLQMLRENLPEDKVLYYDVKSGWEPLCEFLDVPVPEQPFPNADDWKKYKVQRGYQHDSSTMVAVIVDE